MAAIDIEAEKLLQDTMQKLGKTLRIKDDLTKSCYTMMVLSMEDVIAMWLSTNSSQEREQCQS